MSAYGSVKSGCSFANYMVNQTPAFEKKITRRPNQVMSKKGIIRPDRRKKAKFI